MSFYIWKEHSFGGLLTLDEVRGIFGECPLLLNRDMNQRNQSIRHKDVILFAYINF
jgi:hypothetical protein